MGRGVRTLVVAVVLGMLTTEAVVVALSAELIPSLGPVASHVYKNPGPGREYVAMERSWGRSMVIFMPDDSGGAGATATSRPLGSELWPHWADRAFLALRENPALPPMPTTAEAAGWPALAFS